MRNAVFVLIICCLVPLWGLDEGELFTDTFEILGEWMPVNGKWLADNGALWQLDPVDNVTHIYRIVKQEGIMEYSFDLFYREGFEDAYGGMGIHICVDEPATRRSWGHGKSYLLWLTYDEKAYGSPDFFLQVYRSLGPVRMDFWKMERGDLYPLPSEILSPAGFAAGDVLKVRLELDLNTGKGRFYNPRDEGSYFPVDIGIPPSEGLYIALRTNSVAMGVDNFSVHHLGDE